MSETAINKDRYINRKCECGILEEFMKYYNKPLKDMQLK